MNYRSFGATGLKVSEIGFGAWGIGGNLNNSKAYGPTSDINSKKALETAFNLGVNFFDTSPLYGDGHSENLIGETFKKVRNKVIFVTKVGYKDFTGLQDFSPSYIKSSLNKSLKRLKTDYVDIYQLHDIPIDLLNNSEEISDTLQDLKKEGKIRFLGISTKSQEDSIKILDKNHFDCMQINFNLIDQRAIENGLFKKCKENNVAIIGRTPLCFGFLTGKYNKDTIFHKDDHRNRWSTEQINLWASALKMFIKELKNFHDQSNTQLALRFCLSFPEISTTIPGMLIEQHVIENVSSSKLGGFTSEVIQEFKKIYSQKDFFIKK